MGVIIDKELCIRCGLCVEICPEDILVMEEDGVKVRYLGECCWCDSCEMDCPQGAIRVRFTKEVGPVFMRNIQSISKVSLRDAKCTECNVRCRAQRSLRTGKEP